MAGLWGTPSNLPTVSPRGKFSTLGSPNEYHEPGQGEKGIGGPRDWELQRGRFSPSVSPDSVFDTPQNRYERERWSARTRDMEPQQGKFWPAGSPPDHQEWERSRSIGIDAEPLRGKFRLAGSPTDVSFHHRSTGQGVEEMERWHGGMGGVETRRVKFGLNGSLPEVDGQHRVKGDEDEEAEKWHRRLGSGDSRRGRLWPTGSPKDASWHHRVAAEGDDESDKWHRRPNGAEARRGKFWPLQSPSDLQERERWREKVGHSEVLREIPARGKQAPSMARQALRAMDRDVCQPIGLPLLWVAVNGAMAIVFILHISFRETSGNWLNRLSVDDHPLRQAKAISDAVTAAHDQDQKPSGTKNYVGSLELLAAAGNSKISFLSMDGSGSSSLEAAGGSSDLSTGSANKDNFDSGKGEGGNIVSPWDAGDGLSGSSNPSGITVSKAADGANTSEAGPRKVAAIMGSKFQTEKQVWSFRARWRCLTSLLSSEWRKDSRPRLLPWPVSPFTKCKLRDGYLGEQSNAKVLSGEYSASNWPVAESLKYIWTAKNSTVCGPHHPPSFVAFNGPEFCATMQKRGGSLFVVGDEISAHFYASLITQLSTGGIFVKRSDPTPACSELMSSLEDAKNPLPAGRLPCESWIACGPSLEAGGVMVHYVVSVFLRRVLSEAQEQKELFRGIDDAPELAWGDEMVKQNASVVVLNRGAHFIGRDKYREQLNYTLREFRKLRPDTLLIYRSTAAGHPNCSLFDLPIEAPPNATDLPHHWDQFPEQNDLAKKLVESVGGAFLDIYPMATLRPDWHIGGSDCLHYCMPGPMNDFVKMFAKMLQDLT